MTSHNSPVHIVNVRTRINVPDHVVSTENKLVFREIHGKRARPGIASVRVIAPDDALFCQDDVDSWPIGIALYDRQQKHGVSDMAILVQGVAEITCTQAQIESLLWSSDGPETQNNPAYLLRKIGPAGKLGRNDLFIYRCYWNFLPRVNDDVHAIEPRPGIESSETHFVQTRTFNFARGQEDNAELCNSGTAITGRHDNTNIYPIAPTGEGGIMLWPLTKKAAGARGSAFAKAAVMNLGVATLYFTETDMTKTIAPLFDYVILQDPINQQISLIAQVLEIYQSSIRLRIVSSHTESEGTIGLAVDQTYVRRLERERRLDQTRFAEEAEGVQQPVADAAAAPLSEISRRRVRPLQTTARSEPPSRRVVFG